VIPRGIFVENVGIQEGKLGVRGGKFGDEDTIEIFLVEHHGLGFHVEGVWKFWATAFVYKFQSKDWEALEVKLGFGVEIVHENALALGRVEQDETNGHVFWGLCRGILWLGEFGAGRAHLLVWEIRNPVSLE
jgi:hypothetical protein